LWLVLLLLVVTGALSDGTVQLSQQAPELLLEILLLYGYIVALSLPLAVLFALVQGLASWGIYLSTKSKHPFLAEIARKSRGWDVLPVAVFMVVTVLAIPHFGTQSMYRWAPVGLACLLLFTLLASPEEGRQQHFDYIQLSTDQESMPVARLLLYAKREQTFPLDGDWLSELTLLLDREWEILDYSTDSDRQATLLRRPRTLRLSLF